MRKQKGPKHPPLKGLNFERSVKEELDRILEEHRKWVEFEGKEGEPANLQGANLGGLFGASARASRGPDLSASTSRWPTFAAPSSRGPTCSSPSSRGPTCSSPSSRGPTFSSPSSRGPTCFRPEVLHRSSLTRHVGMKNQAASWHVDQAVPAREEGAEGRGEEVDAWRLPSL